MGPALRRLPSRRKYTHSKEFLSKSLNALSRGGVVLDVFEPLRADALIEIHSGAALIDSRRAVFRRNKSGTGVKLTPA
jgi:hypothetical protein